jgi:hypothetical protein
MLTYHGLGYVLSLETEDFRCVRALLSVKALSRLYVQTHGHIPRRNVGALACITYAHVCYVYYELVYVAHS